MRNFSRMLAGCAACFWCVAATAAPRVQITEIMYHPSSELTAEEFIELHNAGTTNVNLQGWRLSRGVDFTFPAYTLAPNSYVVVAASLPAFSAKYPGVQNVVGSWNGILSNSGETVQVDDANGNIVDRVAYADEGDWGQRQRGLVDRNHRGWTWYAEHDGLGKSLELLNLNLPNEHGQNWSASASNQGTPGSANSVASSDIPPLLLQVQHAPIVPTSTDNITFTVVVLDEQIGDVGVTLFYRVDGPAPPAFSFQPMFDDGLHGDGLAGDGRYGAVLPPFAEGTVVEFYVEAEDIGLRRRTWPGLALPAPDESSGPTQSANALIQVGGITRYESGQPVYKMIMTENERAELADIPRSARDSDAQMNATFISLDGSGTEVRYLCGVRNRGHGSRGANPPNYRVNFVSDRPWKNVSALFLNTRSVHVQHLGAVVALKAGAVGGNSRAVQVRVNNANLATPGSFMFGSYAANEAINGDWANNHFPNDGGGNAYKVIRDDDPPNFDYRGPDPNSYRNTYFKQSNTSEDDWQDIIDMLQVMGENSGSQFTEANVRRVIDPEQWLRHMAVMNLFGNNESGLNTGNNDDYYMYRGVVDPRFLLVYHDLDSILGRGSMGPTSDIFRAHCCPISGDSEGSWRAMARFMRAPAYEPIYYRILQELLDTTFSAAQFDSLADQTLGDYVDSATIQSIKTWMNDRRNYVQSVIAPLVQPSTQPPVATITGEPRSPTPVGTATLVVGGERVTHYRYKLNNGPYSGELPVSTPISLSGLPAGSNRVYVVGRTSQGIWQATADETASRPWVVDGSWPSVRLNELLALNVGAYNHEGTFPDFVELYNEGTAAFNLAGLQLTDNTNQPGKFVFPTTMLGAGQHLIVLANSPDGTSGLHTGFGLDQEGEGLFLFDAASRGGSLLDSVVFGLQIADHSIGRVSNRGDWQLGVPSPSVANNTRSLGNPASLTINEWLAATGPVYPDDFVELYNPTASPIALGGLFLTDEPIGFPNQHRIRELSFIPARGWVNFQTGLGSGRARDLSFGLSADQGQLALFSPAGTTLDCVVYGPQQPDTSMGRCADGNLLIRRLALPTPGSRNVCPSDVDPAVTTLVDYDQVWRYEESGNDQGTGWIPASFFDGAWPTGPGVLGRPRNGGPGIPEPVRTLLNLDSSKITFYFRTRFTVPNDLNAAALQITHIVDDGIILYLNGQEIFRNNMPNGQVSFQTLASGNVLDAVRIGPVMVPLTALQAGENTLAAEVHQASSSSADIIFGLKLDAIVVTSEPGQVVINEVFANNVSHQTSDGGTPDWVEFYNPSPASVDLAGLSLSDSLTNPLRWVFPPASIIPAQGFFGLRFDGSAPASPTNTGFGLSAGGDVVYLFAAGSSEVLDVIRFGLQPPDFSIGRVPNGSPSWKLTLPTIGSDNLMIALGDAGLVRINEWMAAPSTGDDWFELFNPNPQPVAVGGFALTDDLAVPDKQLLPVLSFLGAVTNAWQRFEADNNAAAGANHANFRLNATEDTIGLFSDSGSLIDVISIVNQPAGVSQGRLPDGQATLASFTDTASPGQRNYVLLSQIVINEALSHSDLPYEDAIELFNATGSPVDISGWWLSDSKGVPQKYQIPSSTMIGPGEYKVFYEDSFNDGDVASIPFALSSAGGDQIFLSAVDGAGELTGSRAEVAFGPAENGVSFGRHVTSVGVDFVAMSARTFGVDNPSSVALFRTGQGAPNPGPKIGPIVMTEIMFQPPSLGGNDNIRDEFIELHNPGGANVPLYDPVHVTNTWRLRKGVDFDFPPGVVLAPGGFLLVVGFDPQADPAARSAFEAVYGSGLNLYGPYSGKLDNDGEAVELLKPDPPQTLPGPDLGKVPYVLVERIKFSPGNPWPAGAAGTGLSLQRVQNSSYGNEPLNWFTAAPTPGPAGLDDSDQDGMPDDWETAHGLNPNNSADADQDADQDGFTNRQEYDSGTDPQDADSYLKILSARQVDGVLLIRFEAAADRSYSVYYAVGFPATEWFKMASVALQPNSRVVEVSDPVANGHRFYRLGVP